MTTPTSRAVKACETLLREELRNNQEHKIWPTVNRVIERMLARRVELLDVYEELYDKLSGSPRALYVFFDTVNSTPVGWSPEKISYARQGRKDLASVNAQIAAAATNLADLLARREAIQEKSGFSSETFSHPLDVLTAAAEDNHLFDGYVREELDRLQYQFDGKYWPSLSEFVEAIGDDAGNAEITALDSATAAATESRRSGLSDVLKAFFERIKRNTVSELGPIPDDFRISNNALATLINCALDLKAEELIDGEFVKGFRQRERNRKL